MLDWDTKSITWLPIIHCGLRLLIFVEIFFGASVLIGFRIKKSVIPLALVLLVAIVTHPSGLFSALKDVALLSGLVSLWLSGPGEWGIDKK